MISELYRPLFVCYTVQLSYYSRSVLFSTLILIVCAAVGFKHPDDNSALIETCVFLINYAIGLAVLLVYSMTRLHLTLEQLWHYEISVLEWALGSNPRSTASSAASAKPKDQTYFSFIYSLLIFAVTFFTTEALHFGSGGIVWKASCISAVLFIQTVAWLFELLSDDATRRLSGFRVPAIEHLLLGVLFCNLIALDIICSQSITRTMLYFSVIGPFMLLQLLLMFVFRVPPISRPLRLHSGEESHLLRKDAQD
jgi:hypothetical protein